MSHVRRGLFGCSGEDLEHGSSAVDCNRRVTVREQGDRGEWEDESRGASDFFLVL